MESSSKHRLQEEVIRLLVIVECDHVVHVLIKGFWQSLAKRLHRRLHFHRFDAVIAHVGVRGVQQFLPRKLPFAEVDQGVAERLEIVAPALLLSEVRSSTAVTEGPNYIAPIREFYMLFLVV